MSEIVKPYLIRGLRNWLSLKKQIKESQSEISILIKKKNGLEEELTEIGKTLRETMKDEEIVYVKLEDRLYKIDKTDVDVVDITCKKLYSET